MIRIYIIGKISDMPVDYIKNMHQMIKYADKIRKAGFAPYIPCFDILLGLVVGNLELKDYRDIGFAWLEVADGVFVLPNWELSDGSKIEIAKAKKYKIPAFYNINELKRYFNKSEHLFNKMNAIKEKGQYV